VLFAGDTAYGENYQKEYAAKGKENIILRRGYDYPFLRLRPLLDSADLVIANLETPLTDVLSSPYEGNKTLHRDHPEKAAAGLQRQGIKVVSLANNHALDYGWPGLEQTMRVLRTHGIESFGAGRDKKAAGKPWIRDLDIGGQTVSLVVVGAYAYRQRYEAMYAIYAEEDRPGVFQLKEEDVLARIKALRAADPAAFVVAFPHWGWNYRWKNEQQTELAHLMVEAGADLIVGHGAHMLQEIEAYRGKWIIYGVGNLMFGSVGRYETYRAPPYSLLAKLCFRQQGDALQKSLRLYPIVSNNRLTQTQPRAVGFAEFNQVSDLLRERSSEPESFDELVAHGLDEMGFFFFEISL
jgi:poly-gamma-glutamate capsule biosynthesis protein CapA/YwtB (metallophosphatase superfamily)